MSNICHEPTFARTWFSTLSLDDGLAGRHITGFGVTDLCHSTILLEAAQEANPFDFFRICSWHRECKMPVVPRCHAALASFGTWPHFR